MKLTLVGLWLLTCALLLSACDSDKLSNMDASQAEPKKDKKQFSQNKERTRSIRETKKGEFISSKMLPLSEFNPETNEDIYVHLVGQVVNLNKQQTWAVIQDKDTYYFAFGHAGIEMMKTNLLGEQVYLRALIDHRTLSKNLVNLIQNGGLAPGKVSNLLNKSYQLNTIQIAKINAVDKEVFMGLKKD